jgi:hypothetical protein
MASSGRTWPIFSAACQPSRLVAMHRANNHLKTLAKVSNGRTYLRDTLFDITAIYDDLMEHLRLRYVIRDSASGTHGNSAMRRVRVSLIDPRTGGPLRVTDAAGKAITAPVSADASYTPRAIRRNQVPFRRRNRRRTIATTLVLGWGTRSQLLSVGVL